MSLFDPSTLPEPLPVAIRCEPDYYGASHLIAAELGLQQPPKSSSSWVHGCSMLPVPREVLVPHFNNPDQTHLVENEVTQNWWRSRGYPKAVAAGCPILYTKPSGRARIPGSVLAMPMHTHAGTTSDDTHLHHWLSSVVRLKNSYSEVFVCLHGEDAARVGPLVDSLGLSWLTGVRFDTLSLPRVRAMLESFEYVVTDFLGSHVSYAAWCGCKVAFYGEPYQVNVEDFRHHVYYQKNPEGLKNIELLHPTHVKQRFPFLFCDDLAKATCPRAWAEECLGVASQRSAQDIARLLGWQVDDPALADVPYETRSCLLGSSNPDSAMGRLLHKVSALKQSAAQAKKTLRTQEKKQQKLEAFANSLSGRIGRSLYSIEKRARRLFGGKE
jgi:hypothetical protein